MSINYLLKVSTPYISGILFILQIISTNILLDNYSNSTIFYQLIYIFCVCIVFDYIIYKHRNIFHIGLIGTLIAMNELSLYSNIVSNILSVTKPIMFFWIKDKIHYEISFDILTNTKDCLYYFSILAAFVNLGFVLQYKLSLYNYSKIIQLLSFVILLSTCGVRYIFPTLEETEYTQTIVKYRRHFFLNLHQILIGFLWQFYQVQVDYSSIFEFQNILHEINSSLFYCSTSILALSNIIFKYDAIFYSLITPIITLFMISFQFINFYKKIFNLSFFITEFGTVFFCCILMINDLQKKLFYVRYSTFYKRLSLSTDLVGFFAGRFLFMICFKYFNIKVLTIVAFLINGIWLCLSLHNLKYIRKIQKYENCEMAISFSNV